jgi:hypothetical protein
MKATDTQHPRLHYAVEKTGWILSSRIRYRYLPASVPNLGKTPLHRATLTDTGSALHTSTRSTKVNFRNCGNTRAGDHALNFLLSQSMRPVQAMMSDSRPMPPRGPSRHNTLNGKHYIFTQGRGRSLSACSVKPQRLQKFRLGYAALGRGSSVTFWPRDSKRFTK